MVHLTFVNSGPLEKLVLDEGQIFTGAEIRKKVKEHFRQYFGCEDLDFYLIYNGRLVTDDTVAQGNVHIVPRLYGGKGGFGSMLRAIGAQIEKTTNREACRDLSGRRLRDINEEKRLKKWIAEKAEREQEMLRRKRKKLEKLNEIVKHEFKDEDYTKARLEMPEKINEAVEQGLKASVEEAEPSLPATSSQSPSTSTANTVVESNDVKDSKAKPNPKKKIKGSLWVDDLEILDDSGSNSDSEEESPKKKIKLA